MASKSPEPTGLASSSLFSNADSYRDTLQVGSISEDRICVSSACVACRDRHLKCNGSQPCLRCQAGGFRCTYIRSRRGLRSVPGKKGKKFASPVSSECQHLPLNTPVVGDLRGENQNSIALKYAEFDSLNESAPDDSSDRLTAVLNSGGHDQSTIWSQSRISGFDKRERCIEAFFHFFYDSHPFLLPRRQALHILSTRQLSHLKAAMCYIGSRYVSPESTAKFEDELDNLISRYDITNDGFLVQTLLLFAIGLDGNNEQKRALNTLMRAQNLALQLGMNQLEFAKLNGGSSPIVEESWRRTWWELYVVEGVIAGLHQTGMFHFYGMISAVPLPCEEEDFKSGCIPTPHTLDEFDEVSFNSDNIHWSSYAYRIAAVRNLGRILESRDPTFPGDPLLDNLDAHLVNWKLHLPNSKKECFDSSSQIDEMIFQAHMITEVTSVLLNLRHAQFDTFATQSITACVSTPNDAQVPLLVGLEPKRIHGIKAISAATEITKLIGLPSPLIRHTHFFTCAITLASIIHLSCWSSCTSPISSASNADQDRELGLRQQIRMNLGALRALAEIWSLADMVLGQVSRVSQEISLMRKSAAAAAEAAAGSVIDPGFWSSMTADEIMRGFLGDDQEGGSGIVGSDDVPLTS